jgi:hypothetical protein
MPSFHCPEEIGQCVAAPAFPPTGRPVRSTDLICRRSGRVVDDRRRRSGLLLELLLARKRRLISSRWRQYPPRGFGDRSSVQSLIALTAEPYWNSVAHGWRPTSGPSPRRCRTSKADGLGGSFPPAGLLGTARLSFRCAKSIAGASRRRAVPSGRRPAGHTRSRISRLHARGSRGSAAISSQPLQREEQHLALPPARFQDHRPDRAGRGARIHTRSKIGSLEDGVQASGLVCVGMRRSWH